MKLALKAHSIKRTCVILEKNDEGLVFGRIKLILIHNATAVYFVTEKCQSVRLVDRRFIVSQEVSTVSL